MPKEKPPRSFFHTVTKGVFLNQKSSSTTSPTKASAPRASAAARSPAPQGPLARSLADRIGTRETADLVESSSAASHRQPETMSAGSSSRSHFEQSRGLHPRPPPPAAPASHLSKGKGRAPDKWGDSGWGDEPVASSSGGGKSRESRPSGGKDHYDVDLSEASQVADQAEKLVRLDKSARPPGPSRPSTRDDDDDDIQVTGQFNAPVLLTTLPTCSRGPDLRSPSPALEDRPRRGLPPPMGLLPQLRRRPANRHPDPQGPAVPINVPRGYGGASNQGGFSTQGGPSLPYGNAPLQLKGGRLPTYPLQQGHQMRNATAVAAEQREAEARQAEEQRRQENERAMAETRESRKKNKRVTTGGFHLGMDNLSTPKSSREVAPTSLGSFRPGSTGHKPMFGQAPSSASGSSQSPYFAGPSLNSRAFANGGDAYLSQPIGESRNIEAQPNVHLPLTFKKIQPTPPAPKEQVALLASQRKIKASKAQGSPVIAIEDSEDESPKVPLSQQSDDITSFDDFPHNSKQSASAPALIVTSLEALNDRNRRPALNLDPLPAKVAAPPRRPEAVADDEEPIPIFVPKEGTQKRAKLINRMKTAAGQSSSITTDAARGFVPAPQTRKQREQLAGPDKLVFPIGRLDDNQKVRLTILADTILLTEYDEITELADLPFDRVTAFACSDIHQFMFVRIRLEPKGLPKKLQPFQETFIFWSKPLDGAEKLDKAFGAVASHPQIKERKLLRYLTTKEQKDLRDEKSGKTKPSKPPPKPRPIKPPPVVDTIQLDDSDEEDGLSPLPAPPVQEASSSRMSARARGKQRETVKDEPERLPPPDKPHEVMAKWPPTGRPEITILKGDYHRTTHKDEYLNDTIIDWAIRSAYAKEKAANPKLDEAIHIFSSFLYFRLTEDKVNKVPVRDQKDPWYKVRSWTTKKVEGKKEKELKIDLFAKEFIIVPINESYHWYLAIIYNPKAILQPPPPPKGRLKPKPVTRAPPKVTRAMTNVLGSSSSDVGLETMNVDGETSTKRPGVVPDGRQEIELIDELDQDDAEPSKAVEKAEDGVVDVDDEPTEIPIPPRVRPSPPKVEEPPPPPREEGYVFILDSLGYGATAPAKVLSQYLKMEAIEHHGWRADDPWTPLPTFKVDVPKQEDESSCGVYLAHFVEIFLRDPKAAVDFMLTNTKPSRSGSVDHKRSTAEYEQRRDVFWEEDKLDGKREGFRLRLVDLEDEWFSAEKTKAAGGGGEAEKKLDGQSVVQSKESSVDGPAPPAAGPSFTSTAPAPPDATESGTTTSKESTPVDTRATSPSSAESTNASAGFDNLPALPALLTSAASPLKSTSNPSGLDLEKEKEANEEPCLPASPLPKDGPTNVTDQPAIGFGRAPSPSVDEDQTMDMEPLRSSLPRRTDDVDRLAPAEEEADVDELASHVSATPDDPVLVNDDNARPPVDESGKMSAHVDVGPASMEDVEPVEVDDDSPRSVCSDDSSDDGRPQDTSTPPPPPGVMAVSPSLTRPLRHSPHSRTRPTAVGRGDDDADEPTPSRKRPRLNDPVPPPNQRESSSEATVINATSGWPDDDDEEEDDINMLSPRRARSRSLSVDHAGGPPAQSTSTSTYTPNVSLPQPKNLLGKGRKRPLTTSPTSTSTKSTGASGATVAKRGRFYEPSSSSTTSAAAARFNQPLSPPPTSPRRTTQPSSSGPGSPSKRPGSPSKTKWISPSAGRATKSSSDSLASASGKSQAMSGQKGKGKGKGKEEVIELD